MVFALSSSEVISSASVSSKFLFRQLKMADFLEASDALETNSRTKISFSV